MSAATTATESSGINADWFLYLDSRFAFKINLPHFLPVELFPSTSFLSRNFLGLAGSVWSCVLAETRCTVQRTISSVLLFCWFLLRKKFPRIGMSPSHGILL